MPKCNHFRCCFYAIAAFAATSTNPASQATYLTLTPRVPAPLAANVPFNGFTETVLVDETMEYRRGTTGNWTQISPGQTSFPVTMGTSTATYQVRVASTTSTFASAPLNISIPRRASAPNATYNAIADTITGVSAAMEFSTDGGITWTRLRTTVIPRSVIGNNPVTVYVRTAATQTVAASLIRPVAVPAAPSDIPAGLAIDHVREVVTGVAPGMQSSTNGTTWANITTNELNIATMIPGATSANVTLRIRFAPTADVPSPNAAGMILTPRLATPTATDVRFDGFTESILLGDTMEYRIGTTGAWTPISAGQTSLPVTLGTANVTYQVRVMGTAERFPSAPRSVTVPRRPTAPNVSYRPASDDIRVASTAMEFSIDGGITWTRVVGTSISRRDIGPAAARVYVRTAATAAAAISDVRIVDVPSGPSNAPTGLAIDYDREVVTGVAPGMQRSTNGTQWTNITGNELNIASLIPAANAAIVTLQIRFASTAENPASNSTELILMPRLPTPVAANVRFCGFTESILLNDTMEYRVGTTGTWTPISPGQTSLPVTLGSANVTHQVRVRRTADRFQSSAFNVSVPRRLAQPNVSYRPATDDIRVASTAMEFSIDGGTTWTRATGNNIPRASIGQTAVTVYVRTAATAAAAASEIRVVEVPGDPAVSAASSWHELRELIEIAPANVPTTIAISGDFSAPSPMYGEGSAIIIPPGRDITLVSDNPNIMRTITQSNFLSWRHFIVSNSSLTLGRGIVLSGERIENSIDLLQNELADFEPALIQPFFSSGNGGVLVWDGGRFTMNYGSVIRNTRMAGGAAVSISSGGIFEMNAGSEIKNCLASSGGAVNVSSSAVFTMNGGTIRNNSALFGGAVHMDENAVLNMSGGTITNNYASIAGGGIFTMTPYHLYLSPNAVISGNSLYDVFIASIQWSELNTFDVADFYGEVEYTLSPLLLHEYEEKTSCSYDIPYYEYMEYSLLQ